MLLPHTFTVEQVKVREWHDGNLIEVLNEGDAIGEFTDAYLIRDASNSWAKLILLDFAVEQLFNVVDVEARRAVLPTWQLFSLSFHLLLVNEHVRLDNSVTYGVEVPLINVLATSYV